jgi:hypothetical protein
MLKFLIAFGIGVLVILNWPSINAWINKSEIAGGAPTVSDKGSPDLKKSEESSSASTPAAPPAKKEAESRASKLF